MGFRPLETTAETDAPAPARGRGFRPLAEAAPADVPRETSSRNAVEAAPAEGPTLGGFIRSLRDGASQATDALLDAPISPFRFLAPLRGQTRAEKIRRGVMADYVPAEPAVKPPEGVTGLDLSGGMTRPVRPIVPKPPSVRPATNFTPLGQGSTLDEIGTQIGAITEQAMAGNSLIVRELLTLLGHENPGERANSLRRVREAQGEMGKSAMRLEDPVTPGGAGRGSTGRLGEAVEALTPGRGDIAAGVSGAATQLPGLALSLALRSPLPMSSNMALQIFGPDYAAGINEGLPPELAYQRASQKTAVNIMTELPVLQVIAKVPIGKLFSPGASMAERGMALKYLGAVAGVEQGTELSATLGEWVADRMAADPGATLERLGEELQQTFRQMLVQGPVTAGAARTMRSAPGAVRELEERMDPQGAVAREFARVIEEGQVVDAPILSERRVVPAAPREPVRPPVSQNPVVAAAQQALERDRQQFVDPRAPTQPPSTLAKQMAEELGMTEEDLQAAIEGRDMDPEEFALEQRGKKPPADPVSAYEDLHSKFDIRDGKIVGMDKSAGREDVVQLAEKLEGMVKQGIAGKDWYTRSADEVMKWAKGDRELADRMFQIIAITSDGNSVKGQWTMMQKAMQQYERGEPIRVGKPAVNAKMNELLYFGVPWDGRKTNTFYTNLSEAADRADGGKATIDRHMLSIAGGLVKRIGSGAGSRSYDAIEMVTQAVANKMNMPVRDAQAAAWVTQKTLSQLASWERRGIHKTLTEQERFDRAFAEAMVDYKTLLETKGMPQPAGLSRPSDEVRAETTASPIEMVPSKNTPDGAAALALPVGKRAKYHAEVHRSLIEVDRSGGDTHKVLNLFGLKRNQVMYSQGSGSFEGNANSNVIFRFSKDVPASTVAAVVRAMQYVTRQDGIGWFRADPSMIDDSTKTLGLLINVAAPLTPGKLQALATKMAEAGLNYTVLDTGQIALGNWDGMADADFESAVTKLVAENSEAFGLSKDVEYYRSEGDYSGHDWQQDPTGERLLDSPGIEGQPHIQSGLRRLRRAAESASRAALNELSPGWKKRGADERAVDQQGQPKDLTKAEQKEFARNNPVPAALPEAHDRYFDIPKGAMTIRIADLVSSKTDAENESGGANAAKLLRGAYDGKITRRPPITVERVGDGKYRVIDGNGTLTALKRFGWKSVPAIEPRDVVEARVQKLIDIANENRPAFIDFVEKIARKHGGAAMIAKTKGLERATNKVITDYKGDESQLKDLSRGTVVLNTIAEVRKAYEDTVNNGKPSKTRNLFDDDGPGYKDALTVIPMLWGPAEVQFNVPEMLEVKDLAHKYYESLDALKRKARGEGRVLTPAEIRLWEAMVEGMNKVFADGMARYESRVKAGRMFSLEHLQQTKERADLMVQSRWAEAVENLATIASNADFEISLSQEPGLGTTRKSLPSGTSNAVGKKSTTLTGTPSQSKYFTDDIGESPQKSDPNSTGKFTLKTESAYDAGFRGKNTVNALSKLRPSTERFVRQALSEAVESGGLDPALIGDVTFLEYGNEHSTAQARYYPTIGAVAVNSAYAFSASRQELAKTLVHELTHRIDFNGKDIKPLSETSPRLAITLKPDGSGGFSISMEGDLAAEIVTASARSQEIAAFFRYPVDALLNGDMDAKVGRGELLAQAGALFVVQPDLVKQFMPKWFAALEGVYGKGTEGEGNVSGALARAHQRLQDALQNEATDDGVSRGVEERSVASQAAGPGQPGSPRGPPGSRVGAGTPAGPGNPGSGTGGRAAAGRGPIQWSIDAGSLRDDLAREWQNKVIDLKRVQEAIERAGGVIRERGNAYLSEEVYHGKVSARLRRFTDGMVKPLLKEIKDSGLSIEQVGNYLWARHAPERNKQMAKINPNGKTNLSGLYDNPRAAAMAGEPGAPNAADIMAGFTPAQRSALNGIAAKIDAMTKATRDILLKEGLEDAQTIRNWEGAYKHYVPLLRDVDEAGAAQGFQVTGDESKRAMGSTKEAVAIVAAVIAQHEKAIVRAEKAEVARALVRLAAEFPNPAFWRVDDPPTKRTINPTTGLVQVGIDPMYRQRDDVLVVKERDPATGEIRERVIAFNPRNDRALKLAAAMRNLDVVQLAGVTKVVGRVTRIMASLVTSWNPLFWTTNFARDVQTAAVNLQSTPLKGQGPKVMANVMPAMAGIASAEFRNGTGKWAKLYRDFEDNGGKTGWMRLFDDLIDRQNQLASEIKASQRGNIDPRRWGTLLIETIESANTAVENATRLSAYSAAIDHGMSPKAAASLAKNLTVNFNRKGNRSTAVNAWYMFFNASVQGTARMVHAVATSRRAQALVGTMVAFGAALELVNRLVGDDDRDEDGNNPYELLPEFIKQKNMVFMLGDGKRVTIPLPYGFNAFHNAGRMMMEAVLTASNSALIDERKKPMEMAWNFAEVLIDSFLPFGQTSSPAQLISPTVLDPVVQHGENRTWFGSPMRPEPLPFGPAKPDHQLYFRSTSETAKDLTKWLSDMTGGDEVRGGAIDISPTTLVHIFRTITGGAGSFGLGMFDFTAHAVGRVSGEREAEDLPWKNVPFVGKFYGEIDDRDMAAKYYRLREQAQKVYGEYTTYRKLGETDKMDALEERSPDLIAMGRVINSTAFKREMSAIRKEFEATRELSGTERERVRRELQAEETGIMSRAMQAYNDAKGNR